MIPLLPSGTLIFIMHPNSLLIFPHSFSSNQADPQNRLQRKGTGRAPKQTNVADTGSDEDETVEAQNGDGEDEGKHVKYVCRPVQLDSKALLCVNTWVVGCHVTRPTCLDIALRRDNTTHQTASSERVPVAPRSQHLMLLMMMRRRLRTKAAVTYSTLTACCDVAICERMRILPKSPREFISVKTRSIF